MTEEREEHEENPVEVAEITLAGDLMALALDELKVLPDVWQKVSEYDQGEIIDRVRARTLSAAKKAANIIAAMNHERYAGEIESVTFKDGCKVVIKCPTLTTEQKGGLANLESEFVMIVGTPPEAVEGGARDAQPDPDQSDMLDAAE